MGQAQAKGTCRGNQKGGRRKRGIITFECLESKGYPTCSGVNDEVVYRMAGSMVPVDYFERLLRAVVLHLEEPGADFIVQEKPRAYCTLLPEEYHTTKLSTVLEKEAAIKALAGTPGCTSTNISANAPANAPASAPANTPASISQHTSQPITNQSIESRSASTRCTSGQQAGPNNRIRCTGQRRSISGRGDSASISASNDSREKRPEVWLNEQLKQQPKQPAQSRLQWREWEQQRARWPTGGTGNNGLKSTQGQNSQWLTQYLQRTQGVPFKGITRQRYY